MVPAGAAGLSAEAFEGADRVLLPASAAGALAGAPNARTPYTFELRCGGNVAYCGVREFSAPDGIIVLPAKVVAALGLVAGDGDGALPAPAHAADLTTHSAAPGSPGGRTADTVSVSYVSLPKATYVKLQPQTADFLNISSPRAALTRALTTSFSTLAPGDLFWFPHGGREYSLVAMEVKPASAFGAVSVVETDVEVAFAAPANAPARPPAAPAPAGDAVAVGGAGGEAAAGRPRAQPLRRQRSRQAAGAVVVGAPPLRGVVDAGHWHYFVMRVAGDDAAAVAEGGVQLRVHVAAIAGDPDAYVVPEAARESYPSVARHVWAANAAGSTSLTVTRDDPDWAPGAYYIGVTAYGSGAAEYDLSAELEAVAAAGGARATGHSAADAHAAPPAGSAVCSNCHAVVPEGRLPLHEATCLRNNVRCEVCGAVLRKAEAGAHVHCSLRAPDGTNCNELLPPGPDAAAKHTSMVHTEQSCECGASMLLSAMRAHWRAECPRRRVLCRFCGDEVEAGEPPSDAVDRHEGLTGHEAYCGSKTLPCGVCRRPTLLKRMDTHRAAYHVGVSAEEEEALRWQNEHDADMTDDDAHRGGSAGGVASPWVCSSCTLQNGAAAAVCSACGMGRPRAGAAAAAGAPSAGPREWRCGQCTLWNGATDDACTACGEGAPWVTAVADAEAASVAAAADAAPPAPRAGRSCANGPCERLASTDGEAAELSLCSRCYAALVRPYDDERALMKAALARYLAQLTAGCGAPPRACRNPHCAGSPTFDAAAHGGRTGEPLTQAQAALAAFQLAKGASQRPPRFHACVAALSAAAPALPPPARRHAKARADRDNSRASRATGRGGRARRGGGGRDAGSRIARANFG